MGGLPKETKVASDKIKIDMSKHIHFIGIGGIGMGAIASLLIEKDYKVTGSDIKENKLIQNLKKRGAKISIGHKATNVGDADIVVFSSAIDDKNPEMQIAKDKKITLFKRAQMLANLMGGHKNITVAGAHGKTTTTSMISHLLIQAGLEPTTAVGGIVNGEVHGANLGEGTYFVAEVDESDGSFLYFSPYYSIITNIDREHLDHYQNFDNILMAYRKFIDRTNIDGMIFACGEDQNLKNLLMESKREFITYGIRSECDMFAQNIQSKGYSLDFDCVYKGKKLGSMHLQIPGEHNVLNALACVCLGLILQIDFDTIARHLKEYHGVQRRFQLKAQTKDIMVVDDYGHHPTEIKATLKTAKSFDGRRVVVIFQPHRYTRTKLLMDDFVETLSLSDHLILTDIYAASEKPIEGVTTQTLYEKIKKSKTIPVEYIKKEEISDYVSKIWKKGDLILTLGAGDINRISDELVQRLKTTQDELIKSR